MKLHYTSAFVIAGLLAAMPARADGAVTRIGQTSATDCFNAAATVSRTGIALSEAVRKNALTSCAEALTDKITAKDRVATLVNRGTIEASSGDIDSSLADYNAALALNPNMADTYIDRGSALMRAARMPAKEIATGLMTVAVALALVSAPAAYMQPTGASVLGLTVAGSPDMNAGMTVAIPVSGVGGNAVKLPNHRQDHQKHTGS
jgi:hypothetical protein